MRELLTSEVEVAAVVTNPDRPAGRGMDLRASPVKRVAEEAGIELLQPEKARDPELLARLQKIEADVAVVVAYGRILPAELLRVPPLGFVNVHFSLLPAYRGAAPVQHAVMNGDDRTGVCLIVLTEGMDEGPVLACEETPIQKHETAGSVGERLAEMGARLLVPALLSYESGEIVPIEQDHAGATYAPKLTPEDAHIDWTLPAERLDAFVRGLNPVPGAWTTLLDSRLKVYKIVPADIGELAPGDVASAPALVVGTSSRAVELVDVQLAGKKRMSGEDLLRGFRLPQETRLV